jgi:hypothetical protein
MSSTDELLRDIETEETGTDGRATREEAGNDEGGGLFARLGARTGRLFAVRSFLLALVVIGVATLVAGALIPLGSVGGLVGTAAGAFGYGLVAARARYAEAGLAGGLVLGVATLADYLVLSVFTGIGLALPLAAGVAGLVVAALAHYFGRDLRDGLTREL